jgi:ribosomal-protein-alanine N-acetyltransferase
MQVQRLTAEHVDAVLEFETVNRSWFAAAVPDRGDAFFASYPARHAALLALQDAGTDIFHVVVSADGTIAGRVNLIEIDDGSAEIGYRVGAAFAGRGVATWAVREVCELARSSYRLRSLRAVVSADNPGSRAVLVRNGFAPAGETVVDGRLAHRFTRGLRL